MVSLNDYLQVLWRLVHCPYARESSDDKQVHKDDKGSVQSSGAEERNKQHTDDENLLTAMRSVVVCQMCEESMTDTVCEGILSCLEHVLDTLRDKQSEQDAVNLKNRRNRSLHMEVQTVVVLIPHLIIILSRNMEELSLLVTRCLCSILHIVTLLQALCKEYEQQNVSMNLHRIMVPLFVKCVCLERTSASKESKQSKKARRMSLVTRDLSLFFLHVRFCFWVRKLKYDCVL